MTSSNSSSSSSPSPSLNLSASPSGQSNNASATKTQVKAKDTLNLSLDVLAIKEDYLPAVQPEPTIDSELDQQADAFVEQLLAVEPEDFAARRDRQNSVNDMGTQLQKESRHRSAMLNQTIQTLEKGEEGGPVAKALMDLRMEVEALDPPDFDVHNPGFITRAFGWLPFIGTPIKQYFMKFESAQTTIDAIMVSLQKGKDQLKRDNLTLANDQAAMRDLTHKLARQIELGRLLDSKLEQRLVATSATETERRTFIENELLFPLRQRIMDLQQQLAVNQQGVLASEIVVRNNQELVRGVDRAFNVTVTALETAVTIALSLANQRIVLDKISALNQTTNELIARNAERLKQQGVDIHNQASSSMLDIETLKKAFADINDAMDAIGSYRREALPKMAAEIAEMNQLTQAAEVEIQKMEDGSKAQNDLLDKNMS